MDHASAWWTLDRRTLDVGPPAPPIISRNTSAGSICCRYLPFGVGLYRKHLKPLPDADVAAAVRAGTHAVYLVFDGAQTSSEVYLDGARLGSHASGYTPFWFRLSAGQALRVASWGGVSPNGKQEDEEEGGAAAPVLAVKVDATKPDGWWYDGGTWVCRKRVGRGWEGWWMRACACGGVWEGGR